MTDFAGKLEPAVRRPRHGVRQPAARASDIAEIVGGRTGYLGSGELTVAGLNGKSKSASRRMLSVVPVRTAPLAPAARRWSCLHVTRHRSMLRDALPLGLAVFAVLIGAAPASATFPGRDGLIAFGGDLPWWQSPPRTSWEELYVMTRTGHRVERLSGPPARDPEWSPDGTRIAATDVGGGYGDHRLLIIGRDGSRTVLDSGADWSWSSPTWSPDGTRLAFLRQPTPADPPSLWSVAVGGTDLRLISDAAGIGGAPVWSPDGERIAFGHAGGLWTVRVDGSGLQRVVDDTAFNPDWSPDGDELVYSRLAEDGGDLAIAAADGTGRRVLPAPDVEAQPSWSPSGRAIVYQVNGPGWRSELWTMRPDGGSRRLLLRENDAWRPVAPTWQPRPR